MTPTFYPHTNRHRDLSGLRWGWITRDPDWQSRPVGYWTGSTPTPGIATDLRVVEHGGRVSIVDAAHRRIVTDIPDGATALELLAWLTPTPAPKDTP